ncbi:MAG: hypothetical protein SFV54_15025 [Bryobacteraceae bacterium]|nr:hypothetical protein [Bryobacteraceae bacterium]
MRFVTFLSGLLLLASACSAGEVRPTDRIVPLIQDGGGWTTTITLVNLETRPAAFEMLLRSRAMRSWAVPLEAKGAEASGPVVQGAIPPQGAVTIRTLGTSAELERGYAMLFPANGARIGATTTVLHAESGASLVLPLKPEREDRLMIPFDNTAGSATSLVLISETPGTLIDYVALGPAGEKLLAGSYQFSGDTPLSQDVFSIAERFPELKDRSGVLYLELSYPMAGLYDELFFTAFGVQNHANGAASVVPSMSTSSWRAGQH